MVEHENPLVRDRLSEENPAFMAFCEDEMSRLAFWAQQKSLWKSNRNYCKEITKDLKSILA